MFPHSTQYRHWMFQSAEVIHQQREATNRAFVARWGSQWVYFPIFSNENNAKSGCVKICVRRRFIFDIITVSTRNIWRLLCCCVSIRIRERWGDPELQKGKILFYVFKSSLDSWRLFLVPERSFKRFLSMFLHQQIFLNCNFFRYFSSKTFDRMQIGWPINHSLELEMPGCGSGFSENGSETLLYKTTFIFFSDKGLR